MLLLGLFLPKEAHEAGSPLIPEIQPYKGEMEFLQPDPEVVDRLYAEWKLGKKQKEKSSIAKYIYNGECSCVLYAQDISGINVGSIGKARNHPINSHEPTYGAIVVLNEGASGHIAMVGSVFAETFFVLEFNFSKCQFGTREIRKDYEKIIGYYIKK